MRWSKSLIPTVKEDPAEAEAISHKLMVRAGLVRQLAAGIYVYLPLGQRVMDKVNAIVREEIKRIGGQEITMPVLQPRELWAQSGREAAFGPVLFHLRDLEARGEIPVLAVYVDSPMAVDATPLHLAHREDQDEEMARLLAEGVEHRGSRHARDGRQDESGHPNGQPGLGREATSPRRRVSLGRCHW